MNYARAILYAVSLCIAGGAGLAVAGPAFADVKAGVDAWATGDFSTAVREWREPATQGDPDAQFNLAQAYRLGRGVETDPAQAEMLYAKAAAQGHLRAADNYGLLLFQDGRREAALPFLAAASERGDPRAQYLIGLAHFNGDLLPKDWVRAYAFLTLSNSAGLPQASAAIKQMDGFIPRVEREQAQILAQVLKREADAKRSAQLAAADLGFDMPGQTYTAAPPTVTVAHTAIAEAARVMGTKTLAKAGADYAPPNSSAAITAAPVAKPLPKPAPPRTAQTPAATSGPWKVQLGAFSVDGNAEKLWRQLSPRSELSGKTRLIVPSGRLTILLAGGFSSRAAADQACTSLKRAGQGCLVTR